MRVTRFLSLLAVFLGFIGSIVLLKGVMQMSASDLAVIAVSRTAYCAPVIDNLSGQKGDVTAGLVLILCSFMLGLPKEIKDWKGKMVFRTQLPAWLLLAAICLSIAGGALVLGSAYTDKYSSEARKEIVKHNLGAVVLEDGTIDGSNGRFLVHMASYLLGEEKRKGESNRDFWARLGDIVGLDIRERLERAGEH